MAIRYAVALALLASGVFWQSIAQAQSSGDGARWLTASQARRGRAMKAQHSMPMPQPTPAMEPEALVSEPARSQASVRQTDPTAAPLLDEPTGGPFADEYGDGDCDGCGYGGCGDCCWVQTPPSVWGSAEYLLWTTKAMRVPPLVTTSPAGTAQASAGVLGQAGTSILFGNTGINDDVRSGGRFTAGGWMDIGCRHGLEIAYVIIEDPNDSFSANSSATGILARPFFNTQTALQDARLIGFPAVASGSVNVATSTQLQTLELSYRYVGCRTPDARIDYFLGWRYGDLNDTVRVSDSSLSLTGATQGTTVAIVDQFHTTNIFNGAEVGIMLQRTPCSPCSPWSFEILAKIALGNNCARSNIAGQTTTTTAANATTTTNSGLLALGTNRGVFDENKFSSIGELGLNVRRKLKCGFTATLGYRFMYWTDVARAGSQIDTTINTSQIPPSTITGPARPSPSMHFTDFWAQGLTAGLECAF
jgi:hypothetical protein